MSSTMRFDTWQDSNGVLVASGAGGKFTAPGTILQIVSTTKTNTFSATTGAANFTNVTGLSVTITPTSVNSKILLLGSVNGMGGGVTTAGYMMRVTGGNAANYVGDAAGSRLRVVSDVSATSARSLPMPINYLDSPATTSAITYQVQVTAVGAGDTVHINRSQGDSDANTFSRSASTITAIEVAG